MKRLALLLSLLATGALALVIPSLAETVTVAAGSATRSTPPSTTADGMALGGVRSFRITVCAASGQTLSGAGSVQMWLYDPVAALWTRNPGLDQTITVTATSCAGAACQCQAFPDLVAGNNNMGFRVEPYLNAVTVSGGANVTVRIAACLGVGAGASVPGGGC